MSPPETSPRPSGVVRSKDREEGREGVREREEEELPPPPSPEVDERDDALLSTDLDFCKVACRRMTGGRAGGGKPLAQRFLATRAE